MRRADVRTRSGKPLYNPIAVRPAGDHPEQADANGAETKGGGATGAKAGQAATNAIKAGTEAAIATGVTDTTAGSSEPGDASLTGTTTGTGQESESSGRKFFSWWWLIIAGALIFFLLLWRRRKKDKKETEKQDE